MSSNTQAKKIWKQKKPLLARTSIEVTAEATPTETANYPTPPEPVGKRSVKRVQHVQCVIQGHVICSSDQAEDVTDKAAVTDIWQRKKTIQFL